jgi:hypothetical protein
VKKPHVPFVSTVPAVKQVLAGRRRVRFSDAVRWSPEEFWVSFAVIANIDRLRAGRDQNYPRPYDLSP